VTREILMGIIARAFGCRRGFAYCVAAIVALLALLPLSVGAQTSYPVQVNVMVTPPSSVYLTDYYTRGSEKLKVQLLLKEVSRPSFPVKLRFRIEGPALRLTSRPGVNLPPFVLQGGSMVEAAGDLLAPYLSLNALVAEGADAQSFQSKGQRMADGFYKVEVWAEEMGRSVRVSNVATTFISTMLFQSPIVTAPADRSILSDQGIQNIIFQWMPRHLGASLDIAQGTYYKVRLVEVWPSDRDPQEAIRSSKPLYEGLSTSTSFVYGAGQPTLISGRKYALQVQALDADQRDLFTGMGYSNVVSFTYGEECQQPQGLNVEVGGPSGATVLCSGNAKSTGYTFAYRKVYGADTTWQELPSGVPFLSLDGLTPVTSYRVRVAACCGTTRSLWTQPRAFTTLSSPESKFECGKGSNAPAIIDRTPAGTLRVGDKIKAADFTVVVVSASAGANGYSGQGIAQIPFLRNVPAYCVLKDVKVNKELQLVDGSIVLADSVTVVNREIVKEGTRLGNDLFSSLKDRNSNSTVIVTPVSGTITSVASSVASSSNEVTLKGETSKVEVVTSSGQATTSSPGSNSMVVDEAGNTVSVSKNGTATKGRMDKNAFGSGATSSDAAQLASGDSLPKVTFTLDTSKEHYGYDATSLSGEQWVSVKTGSSVAVTASIQRQRSTVRESDIRYRTSDGLVVDAAGTNPATLTVKGLYSGTPVPVLAVADTGKVDSLKKAFICGRIGTVGYDLERRRVWLVPINGAKVNRDAVAKQLNDAYRQAVVEWDVQYDPSLLSVTITDEELRALCSSKDVGMLSNYTLEQQAVLKKFGREPEERTYIMFMVPCKSSYAQGMMPLNRSAGFVFMEGQTDDAVGRTVAHELGHGAFGLEHVGNAKDGSLATTNNLMDYANGTTLDKNQWDAIHSDYRRLTWFQGADEGKYRDVDVMVDPSGIPFDIGSTNAYIFHLNTESISDGQYPRGSVIAFESKDTHALYEAKYDNENRFLGYLKKGSSNDWFSLKSPSSTSTATKVVLVEKIDECTYRAFVVSYVIPFNPERKVLKSLSYNLSGVTDLKEFIFNNCNKSKSSNSKCESVDTGKEASAIRTLLRIGSDSLEDVVNSACISSIRLLGIKERLNLITKLSKGSIRNSKETAILKVLRSVSPSSEGDSVLTYLSENNYQHLTTLVKGLDDDWTLVKLTNDSYGQFLIVLRDIIAGSKSYAARIKRLENDDENRVVSWSDGSHDAWRVQATYDDNTGLVYVEFLEKTYAYSPVGSSGTNFSTKERVSYDPFELVKLINNSDLSSFEAAGIEKGDVAVVPALFLKYCGDKQFNDQLQTSGLVLLDGATIVLSGGTALAAQVIRYKRLWAIAEVIGSFGNIAVNSGEFPELKDYIDGYNDLCAIIGASNLAKLGVRGLVKSSNISSELETLKKTLNEKYFSTIFAKGAQLRTARNAKVVDRLVKSTEKIAYGLGYTAEDIKAFKGLSTKAATANSIDEVAQAKNGSTHANLPSSSTTSESEKVAGSLAKGADELANIAISKGSKTTWEQFLTSNPHLSIEEASISYIKLIEKQSPWPEGFIPDKKTMKQGKSFQMALDNAQPLTSPGRFGTTDNITSVDYVRNKLAVKSNWKKDCGKVVEYRVKKGMELPVQSGPVGPQIDLNADKFLPGGGTQIFIDLPEGANIMDYIEVVPGSVRTIK